MLNFGTQHDAREVFRPHIEVDGLYLYVNLYSI